MTKPIVKKELLQSKYHPVTLIARVLGKWSTDKKFKWYNHPMEWDAMTNTYCILGTHGLQLKKVEYDVAEFQNEMKKWEEGWINQPDLKSARTKSKRPGAGK